MKTRNGVQCINTGAGNTRITRPGQDRRGAPTTETYVQVQLLPLVPRRLEWVNERNLKGA
jgi:hypothetical protein